MNVRSILVPLLVLIALDGAEAGTKKLFRLDAATPATRRYRISAKPDRGELGPFFYKKKLIGGEFRFAYHHGTGNPRYMLLGIDGGRRVLLWNRAWHRAGSDKGGNGQREPIAIGFVDDLEKPTISEGYAIVGVLVKNGYFHPTGNYYSIDLEVAEGASSEPFRGEIWSLRHQVAEVVAAIQTPGSVSRKTLGYLLDGLRGVQIWWDLMDRDLLTEKIDESSSRPIRWEATPKMEELEASYLGPMRAALEGANEKTRGALLVANEEICDGLRQLIDDMVGEAGAGAGGAGWQGRDQAVAKALATMLEAMEGLAGDEAD